MHPASVIGNLASTQLGLVTHDQLMAGVLQHRQLRHLLVTGRLRRVYPRVFAIGGSPASYEQVVLAAVLAAGKTAFASHETAAQLWKLPLPSAALLEVTTVLERRPQLKGVRMHRSGLLIDPDIVELGEIPLSTPERTIVDVSSRLDVRALGRMADDALRRRITSLPRLSAMVERLPRAPGRSPKKMREVLRRRVGGEDERDSALEDYVFDALRRFGLPMPVAQFGVAVNGKQRFIDFAYVREAIALEAKGFTWYRGRQKFDDTTLRGNELKLAGWTVLEFTSAFSDWLIAAQVAEALGRSAPSKPARTLSYREWCDLR